MTQVSIDKDFAIDLIHSKLRTIRAQISEILKKWDQISIDQMIQQSRTGKLPESEIDAIGLTNLQQKLDELEKYQRDLEE